MNNHSYWTQPFVNSGGPHGHPTSMSEMGLPQDTDDFVPPNQPTSAPAKYPATMEFPFNHATNLNRGPTSQPFPSPPAAHPLARFIDQQGPWNPTRVNQPTVSPDHLRHEHHLGAYTMMRGPATSESASVVSGHRRQDSGYRTGPQTYSNGSAEPAMINQDCPDAVEPFNRFHPFANGSRPASSANAPTPSVHTGDWDTMAMQRSEEYECPECGMRLRLKSEMKKHILRHTKPFNCSDTSCPKSSERNGFTTPNDLDRHNRTKHGIFPPGAKIYICASQHCAGQHGAWWPRADNFKQHVGRMHKDEDTQTLLENSEQPATSISHLFSHPEIVHEEASFDTDMSSPQVHQDQMSNQSIDEGSQFAGIGSTIDDDTPPQTQETYVGNNDGIAGLGLFTSNAMSGETPFPFTSAGMQGAVQPNTHTHATPFVNQYGPTSFPEISMNGSLPQGNAISSPRSCPSPQDSRWSHGSSAPTPTIVLHQPSEYNNRQDQDLAPILATPGSLSRPGNWPVEQASQHVFNNGSTGDASMQIPNSRTHTTSSASRSRSQSLASPISTPLKRRRPRHASQASALANPNVDVHQDERIPRSSIVPRVECSKCPKVLNRNCDMKKHERRHTRPFGCTHEMCYKQFGSKNDWKRHESSQHSQEDVWRCDLPRNPMNGSQKRGQKSMTCNTVYYDESSFAGHLHKRHRVVQDRVSELCADRKIGRKHSGTFWCGFCQKIVPLIKNGKKAWDERFDHIGGHYLQDEKHISDWLPPSGHMLVGEWQDAKKRGILALDTSRLEYNSDDDDDDVHLQQPPSSELNDEPMQLDYATLQSLEQGTTPTPETQSRSSTSRRKRFDVYCVSLQVIYDDRPDPLTSM